MEINKTVLYSSIAFVGGAVASGLATWFLAHKLIEKKYADISQKEIDSVKEKFTVPKKEIKKIVDGKSKLDSIATQAANKPSLTEYVKKIKEYTNYSDVEEEGAHFEPRTKVKPFVISPDEYGEDEEYDQAELTFYADGILADEDDTILNIDEVIGKESLNHIGDYEDDAVHVKNEARKIYYEVLVDNRSYKDATGKDPHLDKDEED